MKLLKRPPPLVGYGAGILLAVAAQLARIPLHPQTLIPFITYVPFILMSAFFGGLGPGLLTTGLCTLESLYLATEALMSFRVADPQQWLGLGALALTGVVASALFEGLRRAQVAEAATEERRAQLERDLTTQGRVLESSQHAEGVTEGLRAQLARDLTTQSRMLESIIQHAPVPIALLSGPDFVLEMVNPAFEALTVGEPMVGRTVAEVWPEAVNLIVPLLQVVREAQTVYHVTGMVVPLHRGPETAVEERYFDFSYVPLLGPGGDADVQVLVVAHEVTEYKQNEKALRDANHELATIHANIPMSLFVVDDKLCAQKASDFARRPEHEDLSHRRRPCPIEIVGCLDGLAESAACGRTMSCDDCAIRHAALDSLRNDARHEGVEACVPVSVDGRQENRWLRVCTAPMHLEGKKALICVQDITARKQMEADVERQRDTQQRLAELVRFSHDAIITTSANGVIQGWNKGAEETYGWTETEALGHVIYDFLQTRAAIPAAEINERLVRGGRWDGEVSHVRQDGRQIIVDSRKVLQHDATGTAIEILETNRDITERRFAEEALQKSLGDLEAALKEKIILLKEVHHRVKNNLAVICGLLNMNAGATEIPEAKLALEESQQRVYSIALIHEQLYGTEHLDRINFADYIHQLLRDLNVAFGAAARRISIQVDAEPIEMGVHRAVPCALILNELVANAFKHAFPGPQLDREVRISFRESASGYLELRIQDNGVGCPSFLSWHNGNSVGWRIVNILTKQLGGSLEQEPSPGAHFVLRFPAGTSRRATPKSLAVSPTA